MKNKGYTLIELLAVITILASILTIVVINVNKYSEERKQKDWENIKKIIEDSAKNLAETDPDISVNVDNTLKENNVCKIDYSELVEKGLIDEDTKNPITNKIISNASYVKIALKSTDFTYIYDFVEKDDDSDSSDESDEIVPNYKPKCKRATQEQLHTEICDNSICGTSGSTITYGQVGTKGQLNAGDAFVCDVNADNTFDEEKEMFYYVSDYYDTNKKDFNSNYAVLLFYSNVSNGIPSTKRFRYSPSSTSVNNLGPTTADNELPTKTKWGNITLYKSKRALLTMSGTNSTEAGELPEYNYNTRPARFLTYKELKEGCYDGTTNINVINGLSKCNFLFENTQYASSSNQTIGIWLETPVSTSSTNEYIINAPSRFMTSDNVTNSTRNGVRPAIEVSKSDILY